MDLVELSNTLGRHPCSVRVGPNISGKDYFVGDISGQYSYLKKALNKSGFDGRHDRLFCTGNLIDYGNESLAMLALLEQPWFYSVVGLHELLMQSALCSGQFLHWHTEGGDWAFDDNMQLMPGVSHYLGAIARLPLSITLEHKKHGCFGIISKGPCSALDWNKLETLSLTQRLACLTDEQLPLHKHKRVHGVECVVVGNQAARKPWCRGNIVGINLGARYLPGRGQMKLFKTKRLLSVIESRGHYQAV